ncbi:hypothetical protein PTTG_26341 [Puccinia triticina 1-1 BBBD Race 1]|uniref:BED-type domain-containing protein n=1 Tax=Puccinia triticina (isolate 1-1 / race 1 (BBBD)) TaxID=630390 RepID=A0A180GX62_PUCT1|nr:hypothetical protein PTTG_26341 [Puccinia triticina 1-1 BBBD Race 1]
MARASSSPCQTPSRPPSRQSTRIRTPACSNQDSHRRSAVLLPSPNNTTGKSKRKPKRKKSGTTADKNLDPVEDEIDHEQDSNNRNLKVKKLRGKPTSLFDDIFDYFEPPFHANKGDTGEKMMYKCKWCSAVCKKGVGTKSNLLKHCDGNWDHLPCSAQMDATAKGDKLPLTAKDIENDTQEEQNGMIKAYAKDAAFDPRVFNQLLVLWLVWFSLPWCRIRDFLLGIAFNYAQRGIVLYSRTWAATEAHRLYLNLQANVVSSLQKLSSKFTLIHDVWTTKGNHHAFLGILVAYVTADWDFKISHLGMKFIASSHKGKLLAILFANVLTKFKLKDKKTQTTDLGSNNFTMASEVNRLIFIETGVDPELSANHIRCFCHKIALILNAGLRAIELSTKGLVTSKSSTLGFPPDLNPIVEESEDVTKANPYVTKDTILGSSDNQVEDNNDGGSDKCESNDELDSSNIPNKGKNMIDKSLKKVDFVIQRITSSAAKQSEYKTWCKKLDFDRPSFIAGYSICWNIKFQSRDRGYQAQKIIAKLIENKND